MILSHPIIFLISFTSHHFQRICKARSPPLIPPISDSPNLNSSDNFYYSFGKKMITRQLSQKIREFWFEGISFSSKPCAQELPVALMPRWFGRPAGLDDLIHQNYATEIDRFLDNPISDLDLSLSSSSTEEILSYILLLDQFPRNAFRGTPKSFSTDYQALQATKFLIQTQRDLELKHPAERMFCYLPLEHSEDLNDQELAVEKMSSIIDLCLDDQKSGQSSEGKYTAYLEFAKSIVKYAHQHYDIIKKFGRFPHRNVILNRASTEAETEYLSSGGETFGAKKSN